MRPPAHSSARRTAERAMRAMPAGLRVRPPSGSRPSQSKPAVWALMEYLSRSTVQQRFYELTGNMPPRRSTWQSSTLASSPYAKAYLAQLERATRV